MSSNRWCTTRCLPTMRESIPYFRHEAIAEIVRSHETERAEPRLPALESADPGEMAASMDVAGRRTRGPPVVAPRLATPEIDS